MEDEVTRDKTRAQKLKWIVLLLLVAAASMSFGIKVVPNEWYTAQMILIALVPIVIIITSSIIWTAR